MHKEFLREDVLQPYTEGIEIKTDDERLVEVGAKPLMQISVIPAHNRIDSLRRATAPWKIISYKGYLFPLFLEKRWRYRKNLCALFRGILSTLLK